MKRIISFLLVFFTLFAAAMTRQAQADQIRAYAVDSVSEAGHNTYAFTTRARQVIIARSSPAAMSGILADPETMSAPQSCSFVTRDGALYLLTCSGVGAPFMTGIPQDTPLFDAGAG